MRFAASEPVQNFLARKENYADLAAQGVQERYMQNAAIHKAEGLIASTQLEADAKVEAAKAGASATMAEGQAMGQASMFKGLVGGIGSIAGGFGSSNYSFNPPTRTIGDVSQIKSGSTWSGAPEAGVIY